jgi:hypothetical protein
MASATTLAQISALLASLRERGHAARVVGISTLARCDVESVSIGEERWLVRQCDSALAVREALLETQALDGSMVIVTPLGEGDLESDVRARLARGRLLTLRSWDAVRALLHVRALDPRLVDEALAEEILRLPGVTTRAVPSGFLDLDTAWDLAGESVGLRSGRPDVLELLRWSQEGGGEAWSGATDAWRAALRRRVRASAGPAGEALLDALGAGGADAVALGLACAVIFHPEAPDGARGALERAAGRLERYCGQHALSADAGRRWAAAARTWIADRRLEHGLGAVRASLHAGDGLLREVDAQAWAFLSDLSPLGLEQRLARAAGAIEDALDDLSSASVGILAESVRAAERHLLADEPAERTERVRMALRLVRSLHVETAVPRSFEDAVKHYAASSGFVDWARAELWPGDGSEPLARAYTRLVSEVSRRREAENESFARALADWLASGGLRQGVPRVEDVLDSVVAPLAAQAPVLLLVLDGMSVAVFRELAVDLVREGWVESVPREGPDVQAVLAALPSVTEVSRASLLCGRLTQGLAADEKQGFQGHVVLAGHCQRGKPPLLLHKADLVDGGDAGLAPAARAEFADRERRVVGVVINAVDDHLSKGEQIRPRWSIEAIRPLRAVLHAALEAGRTLIVTSDHGHVVEAGTQAGAQAEAGRWRADDGQTAPGEIALGGARLVLPRAQRLVALWSERQRYGGRKNGYHGGASPQEVVIPLGVFRAVTDDPETAPLAGWREIPPFTPAWWSDDAAPASRASWPVPAVRRRTRPAPAQVALPFEPAPPPANVVALSPTEAHWIHALLRSSVWKAQVQAAGRVALDPERVRQALLAFEERGGTLTRAALGHKLGLPAVRLAGVVVALRRLLNVDGYAVLAVDDRADMLVLDVALLRRQFGLEGGA